ncbi:MAG: AAA domain-containing protein [Roseburia sp.]|nr:AAA domain-containing protein [Roseburia sp.]
MAKTLYDKLYDYREKLRNRESRHTPTAIIADEPLKALARSKPTSVEDMLKIKGIGNSFVTKYGVGFLNVILAESKPVKLTMMRAEVRDTLKNLQSRLTNVNRRNRMLYLTKPMQSRAVDLAASKSAGGAAAVDAVLNFNGVPVTLCGDDSDMYTQYNRLIRAAQSELRETGNNTLYVGYPFVIGKCGSAAQAFNVCAPLILFPVKLENNAGKIVMTTDDSRDITYNNALVLCYNKFNGRGSEPLPPCTPDYVSKYGYITALISFYESCHIHIEQPDGCETLKKLPGYTDKTFPKFGANEYVLASHAAVGMFPMYSGAMQKDFDDIIDTGLMPPTLTTLLEGADEIDDMYGDSTDLIDGAVPVDSEGFIDYINELNVSQERAIEKSATERTLVMQGPPGTGKSQTITSMITDAVDDGKNVLVVSQKYAALSVIYSRLGNLSRYALFVDDPKDKTAFYGRLKAMFDATENPAPFNNVAYDRAVGSVDADIAELQSVEKQLASDEYGATMLKIYGENLDNPFKAAERGAACDNDSWVFRENVTEALLECGYDELKSACADLADEELLRTLETYYRLAEEYDWLIDFKKNLSSGIVAELLAELDGGALHLYAYGKRRFKYKRALKTFLKRNFDVYTRSLYKRFVKKPTELYNGVKAYNDFYSAKLTADSLGRSVRLYFGAVYAIKKATGAPTAQLVERLLDYCGYAYIDRFENEHRDIVNRMSGYTHLVSRICSAIDKKRDLTRDKTMNVLKKAFKTEIADSKRRGDMLRVVDGKRRPAVSKFVEKFEFELFRGVRIFLMTPEAVSEILPLKNDLFELLVFDEASQIYVERGIPAIARAKRLVVCGDHKQLRPSSLGDGRITVDEDEESDAVLEEESLLDIARFKFPEVMLSYHYRSRHEELIAFSNAAFYGGRLNISPNPQPPKDPPIKVHKVNGMWEDRVNKAEADKVVELITEHLSANAALPQSERETLGVISFNAKQRDCVLDLIDKKCDADPHFRELYLAEYTRKQDGEDLGLFVKNIENVQGDERDRIIFTFAYAYNNKGVMSRNFGWLNRPGGENRLNVAISRAKRKIDIVTSIIPSDLRVDDISTTGVHILRKYIDYAYCISDGDKVGAAAVLASFGGNAAPQEEHGESKLKQCIFGALKARGVNVEKDVGMGNYKLDIAIVNDAGAYVLGIECDDSAFSSELSTRERDVMRRKFLAARGWSVMRVWSYEWYADPDKVIGEILSRVGCDR